MRVAGVYLDWAASAPLATGSPLAAGAGNPASTHRPGRELARQMEAARRSVAAAVRRPAEQIAFTSGATEANNIATLSLLTGLRTDAPGSFRRGLVHSAVEHPSVAEPGRMLARIGLPVAVAAVDADGRLDLDHFAECLDEHTRLAAVMAVNNETGAVQPVAEACAIVRAHATRIGRPIRFHADAVQELGKVTLSPLADVDSLAISGHKLGAPRGVGALIAKPGMEVLATGGGQEAGMRPGTENVDGIVALGARAETIAADANGAAQTDEWAAVRELSDQLIAGAIERGLRVVPETRLDHPYHYSPFIVMLSIPGLPADVLVRVMSDAGVYLSRGSACGAARSKLSPVLVAMSVAAEVAQGAFRVSFGATTRAEEITTFFHALDAAQAQLAPSLSAGRR